jgi:hypothetical protein
MQIKTWKELVLLSVRDERAFEEIYARLFPLFSRMAHRVAPTVDYNDATQAAFTALWSALSRVDETKHNHEIRQWCTTVGINAMRDLEKHENKKRPTPLSSLPDGGLPLDRPGTERVNPSDRLDKSLSNYLRHYLTYVRNTGTLKGAHAAVGSRYKLRPRTAAKMFSAHAARYRKKNS